MDNIITLSDVIIDSNKIQYNYIIEGEWQKFFKQKRTVFIEYNCDISEVPDGIAVIPFVAQILPVAWICNAEIKLPVCDENFLKSIEGFKSGYEKMYSMIEFRGKLYTEEITTSRPEKDGGTMLFFSGGVDAFNSLVCHRKEKPTLVTLWGADVELNDEEGWSKVHTHLNQVVRDFGLDYVTVKTEFREILDEYKLGNLVSASGDNWWHGFQHGIGIICHAAPIAYIMKKSVVYFASTFTKADKGKVTCASDPTIDNYVRFGDTKVVHDGYEFTRQMKIHNITEFAKRLGIPIKLRVCWASEGGSNCCKCEKCWRTILGIYAEGADPRQYGFQYTEKEIRALSIRMKYATDKMLGELRYGPIQDSMHANVEKKDLPYYLRWFYNVPRKKLGKHPYISFAKKVIYKIRK